jgi:hypothetical protein
MESSQPVTIASGDSELPLNRDIWVNNIMSFVGLGHFAFVAGISRHMKEYYEAFCATAPEWKALHLRESRHSTVQPSPIWRVLNTGAAKYTNINSTINTHADSLQRLES